MHLHFMVDSGLQKVSDPFCRRILNANQDSCSCPNRFQNSWRHISYHTPCDETDWNRQKMLLQKMLVFLLKGMMPSCSFHPSILRSSSSLGWCFQRLPVGSFSVACMWPWLGKTTSWRFTLHRQLRMIYPWEIRSHNSKKNSKYSKVNVLSGFSTLVWRLVGDFLRILKPPSPQFDLVRIYDPKTLP